ncbi:MAG: hypothetical protein COW02_13650 [Comamonadaceae bacterium CG12_big_fil_rev_8_21_14_0_65_59_15]|nr:MAG: hypothetical protein COW02_13650 [Comamonadaceae bacterium CG12_big_fil_rev_8_21_14_0_65_59_15]
MKTKNRPQLRYVKMSAVAAAVAAIAVGFAGCGGSDSAPVATTTTIPVVGAGNSPFINVTLKATCANGASGTAVIGKAPADPGTGTITISNACTAPILIEAISAGTMRPIGAPADGSGDVDYDPAVNLPISNILAAPPAVGENVTANPVTTAVANAVAPLGTTLSTVKATDIATVQGNVEKSLNLAPGDAKSSQGYLIPGVAAASIRMAEVAALAAQSAATAPTAPTGVTATRSLSRLIAEEIAKEAKKTGGTLKTAVDIANSLSANVANVSANSSISSNAIDSDAARVQNMVATVVNAAGSTPLTTIAALNTAIAGNSTLTQAIKDQGAATSQLRVVNAAIKLIADATAAVNAQATAPAPSASSPAGTTGVTQAEKDTKIALVKAAAAKMVADTSNKIANVSGATTAKDLVVQSNAVAAGVLKAIVDDLSATSANKVFATPPAVGATNAASALVGNLAATASTLTTASTETQKTAVTNTAATAVKVAQAIYDMTPPAVGATASDRAAFNAAIAAVASKTATDPTANKAAFQKLITDLDAELKTKLTVDSAVGTDDAAAKAQAAAEASLGTNKTIDFAAPPTPGTIPSVTVTPPTTQTPVVPATTTTTSTTTTTTTTAAPTSTTTSTSTTTTLPVTTFAGVCEVKVGSAIGYVTNVPAATNCVSSELNVDGGGAAVAVAPATLLTGKTSVTFAVAATCDPLGAPPAAGATTLTACKLTSVVSSTTTTTTAAPTTTTTTAAPTTTTTSTSTTTTLPAATFAGVCEVKVGSAIGYVTNVPAATSCVSSVLNVDGGGATVAVAPATLLTGKTSVSFTAATACDQFGAPPAAGATTLTACKQ